MHNEDLIREIAIRACCEALRDKSQELAEDVARRMGVAFASQPPSQERTKELRDGTVLIASSRTQTEALETLLAATSAITPSCGLLILRGAQATGWSCHGISSLANFKQATLECNRGVVARVINSCTATAARVAELDSVFTARLGLESSAQVLLVPVLLKERVAALLIALGQRGDDLAGLELLVQVAQLTLDMQAYRKAAPHLATEPPHRAEAPHTAEPPQYVPEPQQQPAPDPHQPAPDPQESESVYPEARIVSAVSAAPTTAPETVHATSWEARALITPPPPAAQLAVPAFRESLPTSQPITPVLDETHEKARRFAKLLVEEIKLYNQTKVGEGRARGDLYSRLREDIEKSRAAYHKRYGESVKDVDYFTHELVRILADNNQTVMGPGFPE